MRAEGTVMISRRVSTTGKTQGKGGPDEADM